MREALSFLIVVPIIGYLLYNFVRQRNDVKVQDYNIDYFVIKVGHGLIRKMSIATVLITLIFLFMMTVGYNESTSLGAVALFSALTLLSHFFLYTMIQQKVIIKKDDVTVYQLFGKTKEFRLSEVDEITEADGKSYLSTRFYKNKELLFDVSTMHTCYQLLMIKTKEIKQRLEAKI